MRPSRGRAVWGCWPPWLCRRCRWSWGTSWIGGGSCRWTDLRREKLKRYLEVFGQLRRGRGWSSWSVVNCLQGEDEEELMRKVIYR